MSKPQAKRRYRWRRFHREVNATLDHVERLLGRKDDETPDAFMHRQMMEILMTNVKPLGPGYWRDIELAWS